MTKKVLDKPKPLDPSFSILMLCLAPMSKHGNVYKDSEWLCRFPQPNFLKRCEILSSLKRSATTKGGLVILEDFCALRHLRTIQIKIEEFLGMMEFKEVLFLPGMSFSFTFPLRAFSFSLGLISFASGSMISLSSSVLPPLDNLLDTCSSISFPMNVPEETGINLLKEPAHGLWQIRDKEYIEAYPPQTQAFFDSQSFHSPTVFASELETILRLLLLLVLNPSASQRGSALFPSLHSLGRMKNQKAYHSETWKIGSSLLNAFLMPNPVLQCLFLALFSPCTSHISGSFLHLPKHYQRLLEIKSTFQQIFCNIFRPSTIT
ncbi:hypothetical protein Ahy_A05g023179 isoform A [Arachis hypogaea]|uniref:Uncharacterized protein n=1 Tax=Arachis hypogaea TaxID=3818 RepID=A0A445D2R1_ARAHY|nr:hypothetical protein Ahy_A05g023179 isoform A [Arachis hypogaea]